MCTTQSRKETKQSRTSTTTMPQHTIHPIPSLLFSAFFCPFPTFQSHACHAAINGCKMPQCLSCSCLCRLMPACSAMPPCHAAIKTTLKAAKCLTGKAGTYVGLSLLLLLCVCGGRQEAVGLWEGHRSPSISQHHTKIKRGELLSQMHLVAEGRA